VTDKTKMILKITRRGHRKGFCDIDDNDDYSVALNVHESTARRFVACVNACAGISTKEIERGSIVIFAGASSELRDVKPDGLINSTQSPTHPDNMDELVKDAERYRYLKQHTEDKLNVPNIPCICVPDTKNSGWMVSGDDADIAIDEAIDARKAGELE